MDKIKTLRKCIFLLFMVIGSVDAQENILSEQFVNPERLHGRSVFVAQRVPYGLSNKYYYDIVEATLGTKIISPPVSIKAIEADKVNINDMVEERFITSEEGLNNLNKRRVIIEWDLKLNNELIADGEYFIRIYVTKGKLKDIDSPEFVHKVTIIRKPTEFDIEFANFNQNVANTEFVVIQKTSGSALIVKAVNEGADVKANKWSIAIKNMGTGQTEYSQDIKAPTLTQNINLEYAWYDFSRIEDFDIEHPYTISVRNEDSAGNSFEQSKPFSVINIKDRGSELSDALAHANGELEFYRKAIEIKESGYMEELARLNAELDAYKKSIAGADYGVFGKDDGSVAMESPGTQDNQIFYHIQIYSRNGNNNSSHFPIDESRLVEAEGYYEFYHKTTGYAFFVYATRGNFNAVSAPSHFTRIFDWSGFSHKALEVLVEKAVIQTLLTRKAEVIKLQAVLKNKLVIPRELSVLKYTGE